MSLNQLIYRLARPLGGLTVARYLARKHPRILMYHRITPPGSAEGINADVFRKQMEIVKRSFNIMTLNELMQSHDEGYTPENTVVITFDDGYHDFADYAFPILRELDIPVTLFVTTGFVSGDLWLWPDKIRFALENTKVKYTQLPGMDGVLQIAEQSEECWHRIADHCMLIPNKEKLQLIASLYQRLDIDEPRYAPTPYQSLTWEQLRKMAAQRVEVGSHSHSHPILTQLDDNELGTELASSKEAIRKELGVNPPGFCYPNGQKIDFDSRVQAAIYQAGYNYAIAAFPGQQPLSDRWAIKRYAASRAEDLFEKNIFGLTYLAA